MSNGRIAVFVACFLVLLLAGSVQAQVRDLADTGTDEGLLRPVSPLPIGDDDEGDEGLGFGKKLVPSLVEAQEKLTGATLVPR